jgi:hypothetical protein
MKTKGRHTNRDWLHVAICNSVAAGVVYVTGAGNTSGDIQSSIPAGYDEVLTATAMGDSDGQPGGLGAPTLSVPRTPSKPFTWTFATVSL